MADTQSIKKWPRAESRAGCCCCCTVLDALHSHCHCCSVSPCPSPSPLATPSFCSFASLFVSSVPNHIPAAPSFHIPLLLSSAFLSTTPIALDTPDRLTTVNSADAYHHRARTLRLDFIVRPRFDRCYSDVRAQFCSPLHFPDYITACHRNPAYERLERCVSLPSAQIVTASRKGSFTTTWSAPTYPRLRGLSRRPCI